jgi:hypothetical protein
MSLDNPTNSARSECVHSATRTSGIVYTPTPTNRPRRSNLPPNWRIEALYGPPIRGTVCEQHSQKKFCGRCNVSEDSDGRLGAGRSSNPELMIGDHNVPVYVTDLMRHFVDLRDNTHGGSSSRHDKEDHFAHAVELLDPVASQVLREMNTLLLLESGRIAGTGLRRAPDGGLVASWALSWPEQHSARVSPVLLMAHYGSGSHHPHLRGATVRDWPLNIFTRSDAAEQVSILRAIAAADLHNLVFEAGYTIVPAVVRGEASRR